MGSDRLTGLSEDHAELRATTALALRTAVLSDRRAWNEVERVVRDFPADWFDWPDDDLLAVSRRR